MTERKILLIEDNSDDIELTLRALKKNNIMNEVVVIRDGAKALEYLCGRGGGLQMTQLPAVVLLDLKLPKVSGLDVLALLRANPRTKSVPVVVLTSSKEDKDLLQSYSLGANSYVRKPVDFHDFMAAVHQLGLYWLLLNELPPETTESNAKATESTNS
jgi:two-component system, response regulator